MKGSIHFLVGGLGVLALGLFYMFRPEWFSRGWFGPSRVELPTPKRNRQIGLALAITGLLFLAVWTWWIVQSLSGR